MNCGVMILCVFILARKGTIEFFGVNIGVKLALFFCYVFIVFMFLILFFPSILPFSFSFIYEFS